MIRKYVMLLTFLGTFGLDCTKHEPAVSGDHDSPSISSPSLKDTVRLSPSSAALVGIRLEKAKTQGIISVLKVMGKILACQPRTTIVSHAFPARVAAIHVGIGEWVEQGQNLVTLESQDVGNAMSEYYKALANFELARLNLNREKSLLADGFGVKKNHVAAEGDYKITQANVEAAEKGLHVLGFTEKQVEAIRQTHQISPAITLDAPIAGKVVALNAVRGGIVDQSTEIMTIIDPRVLWADAEVYEKDIAKIKINQQTEIAVPAYPGETFRGKIIYIADLVNVETRTITVRAELDNTDCRLKAGMFADITIILNHAEQMMVIPSAAVLEDGDRKIVFVKEKDGFVRREIETRSAEGDLQPVVKGLIPGEEVVIEGNHELKSKLHEEVLKAAEVH